MTKTRKPPNDVMEYFTMPQLPAHRQFMALYKFFAEGMSAEEVARLFGYQTTAVYSFARNFKQKLKECQENGDDPFFQIFRTGPKQVDREGDDAQLVIEYRKRMLSIPEIEILMAGLGRTMSAGLIGKILRENGFTRMPKRDQATKDETYRNSGFAQLAEAPASKSIMFGTEESSVPSRGAGLLCFLPIIKKYGVDRAIEESLYPGTTKIPKLNAILCFLALKLSSFERYGHDDAWCMDRGLGMFAGLNVLPKTTWFSIYSDKTTRDMNVAFLKGCNRIWRAAGLLKDTVNMDFATVPYWGDPDNFERNWSGKRHTALESIEAALAHDPDTGIICYGDTTVLHDNQNEVVLEFLDFYRSGERESKSLKYLVFDSKFTVLENLGKLDEKGIKFITIQKKSKNQQIKAASIQGWKTERISLANHKTREICFAESAVTNYRYGKGKQLRQVFLKGSHVRHSCIITNDTELSGAQIVNKYAHRWLVENEIQEHVDFFHLNRNSSGIVIKVDFDLTMTILAHNLYRLLAKETPRYQHCTAKKIFHSFTDCFGEFDIGNDAVDVKLNLRRGTQLLLAALPKDQFSYQWIGGKKINFQAGNHS
ncbi:MAG: transposase [Oscillospiraceae bacterium]|nr:transposase [Oscillospiraceae bacterium]